MIPDLLVQDPPVRDDDNREPPLGGSMGALGGIVFSYVISIS